MSNSETVNPLVTAEDAAHWMEVSHFGDPDVRQMKIDQFIDDPTSSTHMFIAMLVIEQCARSPQNLDDMYFAVRDYATRLSREPLYGVKTSGSISRAASIARGEVVREIPDCL